MAAIKKKYRVVGNATIEQIEKMYHVGTIMGDSRRLPDEKEVREEYLFTRVSGDSFVTSAAVIRSTKQDENGFFKSALDSLWLISANGEEGLNLLKNDLSSKLGIKLEEIN